MKRCLQRLLQRCLKAGLIVCGLWSTCVLAIDPNKADMHLNTVINGNNVMHGTINPGGQGCSAGQFWDIVVGGCTSPVNLRTASTSQACDCSCPGAGSCSASQSGTYPVFGWRIPTSGTEMVSHYGPTSWGACSVTSNNCQAVVPPGPAEPPAPAPGATWQVTIYICDASSQHWNTGVANMTEAQKVRFVNTYRDFNFGKRCPEAFGWTGWQATWNLWANQMAEETGMSYESALELSWVPLLNAMNEAAAVNRENTPEFLNVMHANCTDLARSTYGDPSLHAVYLIGSGDKCQII